jgi:hypothetical protein
MRKLFSGLTLVLVLTAMAALVQAQSGMRITGQTLSLDRSSGFDGPAHGSNVVIRGDVQIRADKMTLDPATKEYVLEGNVRLSQPAQAPSTSGASRETGAQFYLRFVAMVPEATTLDQVRPFWDANLLAHLNITLDKLKQIESMATSVKVTKETATNSGAVLSLEGLNLDKKPITATVALVKENGAWKIASLEGWSD